MWLGAHNPVAHKHDALLLTSRRPHIRRLSAIQIVSFIDRPTMAISVSYKGRVKVVFVTIQLPSKVPSWDMMSNLQQLVALASER